MFLSVFVRLLAPLFGFALSGATGSDSVSLVLLQGVAREIRSETGRSFPGVDGLRKIFRFGHKTEEKEEEQPNATDSSPQKLSEINFMHRHGRAKRRLKTLDGSKVRVTTAFPTKINSAVGGDVLVTLKEDIAPGYVPNCWILSYPNGWELDSFSANAIKEGNNQVRCSLPAIKNLDSTVRLQIGNGQFGENTIDIDYVNPLVASFDLTPYFAVDQGFLLVRTALSGAWRDLESFTVRVTCPSVPFSPCLYEKAVHPRLLEHNKYEVNFDNFGISASFDDNILVELMAGEESLASVETRLVRVPGKRRGQVAVDHQRRSLQVDGRPFLPISWFMALDHGSDQVINNLREMSRRGANSVMIYNLVPAYSKTKFKVRGQPGPSLILDACVTMGIKVHAYVLDLANDLAEDFDEDSNDAQALAEAIQALREHPAILSWYVADDDSGNDLPRVYKFIKKLDPYHPVSIAVAMPRQQSQEKYVNGADIIMTETYPSDGDAAFRIMQTGDHWPTMFMPSITCGRAWTLEEDGFVISREVFRSQLYHAVIGGATGEVWFRYHEAKGWNNPGVPLLEESGNSARELLEIVPSIINSGPWDEMTRLPALKVSAKYQNGTIARSKEDMRARAMREPSGMVTLLVANGRNEPMQAIVQFQNNTPGVYDENVECTEAIVPFELSSWRPRRVNVCGGLVTEWLPSWGVQMFRFNGTSDLAIEQAPSYAMTLHALMAKDLRAADGVKDRRPNLIINPGFETSSTFVSAPDGWYCGMADFPKGQPDSNCFADTTIKRFGRHSGRFVTGKNPYVFRIRPTTWLNADSYMGTLHEGKYKGSVWAQSDRPLEVMAVRIWAATGADVESPLEEVLSQVKLDPSDGNVWEELAFEFELKEGDEPTAGLAVGFKVSRPGVLWLDDMTLFLDESDDDEI